MGYMNEFPRSRMFDSDLREILEMYNTVKGLPSDWNTFKQMMNSDYNTFKEAMGNDWTELKNFVNTYFRELDVQNEINNKIDSLVADGTMDAVIRPIFEEYNAELNLVKARLDNLARLEEGSTTGDAELTDGRVDYKGDVHTNIGEHIREVSSQLSSEIAKSVGYKGLFYENNITDCNNVVGNGIYFIPDYTGVSNLPTHKKYPDIPCVGLLIVMSNEISRLFQLFYSVEGVLYIRFHWDTWTEWDSISTDTNFNNAIETLKETTMREYTKQISDNSVLVSLNECANNTIYRLNIPTGNVIPDNAPFKQGIVFTVGYNGDGVETKIQFAKGIANDKLYVRINWADMWQEWQELVSLTQIKSEIKNAINSEKETYEQMVDFGFFEKIAIIGDSYASGEIYTSADNEKGYIAKDYYNLSWGQILARRYGNICVNLSAGGLTTRTWLTSEHGLIKMKENDEQQLYLCMLGHNDEGNSSYGSTYLGNIEDITTHTNYEDYGDTFYGNYGKIIEQIKEYAPNSKIVLLSVAYLYNSLEDDYTTAIREIADHYEIPFINIKDDSFFASTSIYHTGKKWNHPTAPLYAGMANAIARLFNKCVIDNYEYFADCTW